MHRDLHCDDILSDLSMEIHINIVDAFVDLLVVWKLWLCRRGRALECDMSYWDKSAMARGQHNTHLCQFVYDTSEGVWNVF